VATCGILPSVIRPALLLVLCAGLAACASPAPPPVPVTPAAERAGAPVVRSTAAEAPASSVAKAVPSGTSAPSAVSPTPSAPSRPGAPVVLPPDAIYVCVVGKGGQREMTVIEFAPKVYDLCRRHPEMGPCQYERNQCRAAGGRVYARGGEEITLAREAEYDKKVLRVRFRAN